ncbi:DNA-binding protein [Methylobacterium sp. WL9]|uniref:DNA-binding protein n=1 Tax=Methylobacterium sp. WL9 TaxID=2603898 RepID=UPI001650BD2F|nr:DNA-binding protein [Methylobacterium sp. WL9]
MTLEEDVWSAADEVHRTGEPVNQDRVIAVLQGRLRGRSPRKVGPHLLSWKAARHYDARLDAKEFPARLKSEHAAFMERAWQAALIEASERFEDRRRKVEAERQAARELMDEAYVKAEVALREAELSKARVAELEAEVAKLRERVGDLVAEEFWDRVMREIGSVLPPDVWVQDREVIKLLSPFVARQAISNGAPLSRGTLNRKMGIRVTHTKYFERETRKDRTRWYRRKGE